MENKQFNSIDALENLIRIWANQYDLIVQSIKVKEKEKDEKVDINGSSNRACS